MTGILKSAGDETGIEKAAELAIGDKNGIKKAAELLCQSLSEYKHTNPSPMHFKMLGSGWITGESFAQTRSAAFVEISSISNATLVLGRGEPNLYYCKVVEILIVTSYISGQQHLVRMNSIFNATQGLVGMNPIFNVARCFLVGTSLSVGQVIDSHSTTSAE
ncbi:hypothetical protein Q3G72_017864 [Acer saccharum]|nr:hypothetical protein Q3G72_017864 [Acer saccharum]